MPTSDVIVAAQALIDSVSDNIPDGQYSQEEWIKQVGKIISLDNQRDHQGTIRYVGDAARILAQAAGLTIKEEEPR